MIECSLCSEKVEEMGIFFRHRIHEESSSKYEIDYTAKKEEESDEVSEDDHFLCNSCLQECVKICTCEKKFREEPNKLVVICPCSCDAPESSEEKLVKLYFSINYKYMLDLLRKWNDQYYIIDGCRGCKFEKDDIQTNILTGFKSAIEACVYELKKNKDYETLEYVNDALDEDFVQTIKEFNPDIYKKLGLDNVTSI